MLGNLGLGAWDAGASTIRDRSTASGWARAPFGVHDSASRLGRVGAEPPTAVLRPRPVGLARRRADPKDRSRRLPPRAAGRPQAGGPWPTRAHVPPRPQPGPDSLSGATIGRAARRLRRVRARTAPGPTTLTMLRSASFPSGRCARTERLSPPAIQNPPPGPRVPASAAPHSSNPEPGRRDRRERSVG